MTAEEQLLNLNIVLPPPVSPRASFVAAKQVGNLLYLSGQDPFVEGTSEHLGKLGEDLTVEEGYSAARTCGLNLLAQARDYLGDLNQIRQVVQLTGYVASADDFYQQHLVVDGASDLMLLVFGQAGKHTRCAIGTNVLLKNIPVEVAMIVELWPTYLGERRPSL